MILTYPILIDEINDAVESMDETNHDPKEVNDLILTVENSGQNTRFYKFNIIHWV